MKHQKKILSFFLFAYFICSCLITVQAAENVLFILDGSGSMWGEVQGDRKISVAKSVMTKLVRGLPQSVKTGLQVYGHRTKGQCDDIEIMTPLGADNRKSMIEKIKSITPKGKTPITRSIELAADHLRIQEEKSTIILVSDGKETCDRDPCAAVRKLRKLGVDFKVHVVGFDVGAEERKQLQCIADAGNGLYIPADNADQLQEAMNEVKEEVISSSKRPSQKGRRKAFRGDCKKPRERWNSTHVNGAFVDADDGCAWSYGYQTISEARKAALDKCREELSNCRVVAENAIDEYKLTKRCQSKLDYWRGLAANGVFAVTQNGDCAYNAGREEFKEAKREILNSCKSADIRCKIIEEKKSTAWELSNDCRNSLEQWRKQEANAAFVVSINGNCSYSHGYQTIEQAKNKALELCKNSYRSCKVHEEKEAKAWAVSDQCKKDLNSWKSNRPNGVFAVTRNGQCSYNYGYGSIEQAREQMQSSCRSNSIECKIIEEITVKEWELSDSCKSDLERWRSRNGNAVFAATRNGQCTYNSGVETIEEARREIKKLCSNQADGCKTIEEIKSKDWELSKDCAGDYNRWKAQDGNAAFVITINGNCAYASGYGTIEEAREAALSSCRGNYKTCKVLEEKAR